jgi:hypothetical protein
MYAYNNTILSSFSFLRIFEFVKSVFALALIAVLIVLPIVIEIATLTLSF